jgi:hypothetical protein
LKKTNVKSLKKKSDILWAKIVREVGMCERCKSKFHLNAHHIIGRSGIALRYDLENGVCLCVGCHYFAHNKPTEFTYWLEEKIGREMIETLHKRDKPTFGTFDYEDNYKKLLNIYNKLYE